MSNSSSIAIPRRQIRALYDEETITVYQGYSVAIAAAAVREQKLHSSPDFLFSRMTWIKPSWCWMMYRSGYSTKDPGQARILALRMSHDNFRRLLSNAIVTEGNALTNEERVRHLRVQWDPERSPSIAELPYRSIQIGIGRGLSQKWAEEWIESIVDVTDKVLALKEALSKDENLTAEQLREMGVLPTEKIYEVSEELREILKMGLPL